MLKTLLLILGCISFIIVIGGATYEHAAVVPVWSSAVPQSLSMFQGDYALAAWKFWIPVHPVTMVLLIAGLIANWHTSRRRYIIAAILAYAVVLAVTFTYFVPELWTLIQTPYNTTIDADLTRRAGLWETFSLARLGCMIATAVVLLLGLSKGPETART